MAGETNGGAPLAVTAAEVHGVLQNVHGADCKLLDYEAEKGTKSVQGFLSNIIRVTARVKTSDGQVHETKFIIKRMPDLPSQQELVNELGAFEHEIAFFEHCAPLLKKNRPDLPIVTCHKSNLHDNTIYMEDLKEEGFVALVRNVADLKHDILNMEHYKLMMDALAKFHSASVGINWLEVQPDLFEFDPLMEGSGGELFKKMLTESVQNTIVPIAEHHFKGNEDILKSIRWVAGAEYFELVRVMSKANPKVKNNVLCHGDSWANNMMFKIDPVTKKPISVKLIDFQICRYAPATRDLLYCLNMCANHEYRAKHETEILEHYLNSYNNCLTEMGKKDHVLTWNELIEEYENSRLFGMIMAVAFRPMVYIQGSFPEGDDALTDDQIKQMMEGGKGADAAIQEFKTNKKFQDEIISTMLEVDRQYKIFHP